VADLVRKTGLEKKGKRRDRVRNDIVYAEESLQTEVKEGSYASSQNA
jgi:hypothetical protein